MKNVRIFVILMLLAIAAPIAIHYRAWSLGLPGVRYAAIPGAAQSSQQSPVTKTQQTQSAAQQATPVPSQESSPDLSNSSFSLPGAGSSLPLLSVIGFGVFIGGLISALRTRPAHK